MLWNVQLQRALYLFSLTVDRLQQYQDLRLWTTCFYCIEWKFSTKTFPLYMITNKPVLNRKYFCYKMFYLSESCLSYRVCSETWPHLISKHFLPLLLSLRMLTLANLECQWSPLKVIYDVICDGLWYLRALQMTVPREGDATRPASISHAHVCRETGNAVIYQTQTFTRFKPL